MAPGSSEGWEISGGAWHAAGHTAALGTSLRPWGTPVLIIQQVTLLPCCCGQNRTRTTLSGLLNWIGGAAVLSQTSFQFITSPWLAFQAVCIAWCQLLSNRICRNEHFCFYFSGTNRAESSLSPVWVRPRPFQAISPRPPSLSQYANTGQMLVCRARWI